MLQLMQIGRCHAANTSALSLGLEQGLHDHDAWLLDHMGSTLCTLLSRLRFQPARTSPWIGSLRQYGPATSAQGGSPPFLQLCGLQSQPVCGRVPAETILSPLSKGTVHKR